MIGADGGQLGIIPTDEAMGIAREAGLDLVEVAPNEKPPVCRIMDFGKFKYQQKKKLHKTHVHHTKIKEIRLRPKTGEHDIEFKVNQAKGFLMHKDKVVVSVVFRGRELAHIDEGQRVMKNTEITVRVVLGRGAAATTVWTCDLSHDYVSINADYRS